MHSWYGVEKFDIEDRTGGETDVLVSNQSSTSLTTARDVLLIEQSDELLLPRLSLRIAQDLHAPSHDPCLFSAFVTGLPQVSQP